MSKWQPTQSLYKTDSNRLYMNFDLHLHTRAIYVLHMTEYFTVQSHIVSDFKKNLHFVSVYLVWELEMFNIMNKIFDTIVHSQLNIPDMFKTTIYIFNQIISILKAIVVFVNKHLPLCRYNLQGHKDTLVYFCN